MAVDAGPILPRRAGAGLPGLYTYHLDGAGPPPAPGTLVVVPFGPRQRIGVVFGPGEAAPDFQTRPLGPPLQDAPLLSPRAVALAGWIATTYRAPLFDCLAMMLPPGSRSRLAKAVEAARWPTRRSRAAPDEPCPGAAEAALPAPDLTPDQVRARDAIVAASAAGSGQSFLLYGVTGSGKTLVYLEAAAAVVALGKQVVILVSEINLTPTLVDRFRARFHGQLALLHSRLRPAQHHRDWLRVASGEAQVVIGARSALFAPAANLGLIVLDEEHEWSYKQAESPRYHAREAALELGRLAGAPVVLASATPDVCTTWLAEQGVHHVLPLRARYGRRDGQVTALPLPPIQVVDMRDELRDGNAGLFSRALEASLRETLGCGEQAILFINRRGTATCVTCRECGHVAQCRRCEVPLVYHREIERLVCHRCNRRRPSLARCPSCGGGAIRYLGVGTQRVVDELEARFPGARVLRMDRDAVTASRAETAWRSFADRELDVLVGTQMVAKALDFPYVTLVGVVLADVGLFLPDFRAGERTFQLLSQVAGRAGRSERPGRVVVQTYVPDHYVVRLAAAHDYRGFYRREVEFRRQHGYPPFERLVRLVYAGSGEQRCWRAAARLRRDIAMKVANLGEPALRLLGPAPCYFQRIRGRWRWQLLLLGQHVERLLDDLVLPPGWILDVDPVDLL